ncbi:conserved hypothetical protein [Leishmania mexicana MHOM/GT/2001/U1103]|uniref:Uncharacterized protein n=1 Tax=Leishmania mexicana (strain MHOM/GT/2001/U1103) TaxID=929439 RepID=E9AXF4_LEIMU|nr:conserved hypothetical protein [Leishmania mexicana MHOM/GT/2001/U1103]CBZ27645.1 conserved hypothetical protein [Leishmania mexicana MHOM/GT/2001/U1103]
MGCLAEPSFLLRHIRRCGADDPMQTSQQATASTAGATTTSDSSYTTEVLLKVGVPASFAPAGSSSGTASPAPVCYMCPAYILQAGCPALRELLADAFEGDPGGVHGGGDKVGANSAAAVALRSSSPVAVPLPFLDKDVFDVVAVYLEHFHAFDYTTSASIAAAAAHPSPAFLSSSARAPSSLQRPLNFQDLYALSTWEHYYVLCQLLGLERSQVDSLRLVECGAWVDLLGGAAAVPLLEGGTQQQQQQRQVTVTHEVALSQQRTECFSLANRRRMWSRLCRVLGAASRLGMPTLRLLCATVAADMLVDLDEAGLARLMQSSEDGSSGSGIPPFTPQGRAQVLERFPWLMPR